MSLNKATIRLIESWDRVYKRKTKYDIERVERSRYVKNKNKQQIAELEVSV